MSILGFVEILNQPPAATATTLHSMRVAGGLISPLALLEEKMILPVLTDNQIEITTVGFTPVDMKDLSLGGKIHTHGLFDHQQIFPEMRISRSPGPGIFWSVDGFGQSATSDSISPVRGVLSNPTGMIMTFSPDTTSGDLFSATAGAESTF